MAGDSMSPTLSPGTFLLATERGAVRRGGVVVVRRDGLDLVKRVVRSGTTGIEVAGDNPAASTDSRHFGSMPAGAVAGVVRLAYWPPSAWRVFARAG